MNNRTIKANANLQLGQMEEALNLTPPELAEVRAILATHVPGLTVWAFGSRVTGRRKQHSDLDLVLITDAPLPLGKLALLEDAFAESDLPFRVDVVDWARTTPEFREIILRAYEPIEGTGLPIPETTLPQRSSS
jgi:predicted nucleotidyltransferase